jgi:hypothetical protein
MGFDDIFGFNKTTKGIISIISAFLIQFVIKTNIFI